MWAYDDQHFEERESTSVDECVIFPERPTVTWINVSGIHDVQLLEKLGECYGIHPLVLEDIAQTEQRPKMDEFEDYVFIISQMLFFDEEEDQLKAEQFSVVLGENFVISFQEMISDIFDPLRERIRKGKGRIRKMGADYLMYAMIDAR